ncbi:MAG: cysteine desulfurase [Bacillus sp. (in: Bacteria)]|nr:cysteine desulfurase [Bacillus sp. (in: firmicutes)]
MSYIYLDNSATTKPYPQVINKVTQMLTEHYGNPSSIHRLGRESRAELEDARKIIADSLGASPSEIYFTSGGTEANNLAIKGACLANAHPDNSIDSNAALGSKFTTAPIQRNHIITTAAEHPAVTKTVRDLKRQGWKVTYVEAPNGRLDLDQLATAITAETVFVSAMLVNNETGHIFPIAKIKQILLGKGSKALVHCDAVQGYGKIPFTVESLGADLITISGHKIHGPKGIGALYVKGGTRLYSLNLGGGQEQGLRSGTENTAFAAGLGEAVRLSFADLDKNRDRMSKLRDYCMDKVATAIPRAVINSTKEGVPHIVNLSLSGLSNKEVVEYLDKHNIFISSAAACKAISKETARGPSMLESLLGSRELADSAIRISFSPMNTREEVDQLVERLMEYCEMHKNQLKSE